VVVRDGGRWPNTDAVPNVARVPGQGPVHTAASFTPAQGRCAGSGRRGGGVMVGIELLAIMGCQHRARA
jgi:hypothetical protein